MLKHNNKSNKWSNSVIEDSHTDWGSEQEDFADTYEELDLTWRNFFISGLIYLVFSVILVILSYTMYNLYLEDVLISIDSVLSGTENSYENYINNKDKTLLVNRKESLEMYNNSGMTPEMLSTDYKVKYCIGDMIESDYANFQVISVGTIEEKENTDIIEIVMLVENTKMTGGIVLTDNTNVLTNNSPNILVLGNKSLDSKGLTLSNKEVNKVIPINGIYTLRGNVEVKKGEKLRTMLIRFNKDANSFIQVDLRLANNTFDSKVVGDKLKYTVEGNGIIRAESGDTIHLDNGVSIQVLGKYYRNPNSTYKVKPKNDTIDIGVEVKFTNNSDSRIPIAERYNFTLLDSTGSLYNETIDKNVWNLINNTMDRPVLDVGDSITGFINFEAYDDTNHVLLISEVRHFTNLDKSPVYNSGRTREDTPYLVCVKLPKYGSYDTPDIALEVEDNILNESNSEN